MNDLYNMSDRELFKGYVWSDLSCFDNDEYIDKMERMHKCDVNQTEPTWPFFDGNNYFDPNEEENT